MPSAANFNLYFNEETDTYEGMPYGTVIRALTIWGSTSGAAKSEDSPILVARAASETGAATFTVGKVTYYVTRTEGNEKLFNVRPGR